MRWTFGSGVCCTFLWWASIGAAQPGEDDAASADDASAGASISLGGSGADATADSTEASEPKKESLLDDRIGIDVGVRVGYAVPFGNVAKLGPTGAVAARGPSVRAAEGVFLNEYALRQAFDGQLPLQLDLGFRITENIVVGVYGSWGKAFMATSESPFNCNDQLIPESERTGTDPTMMMPAATPEEGLAPEYSCSASILRAGIQARYHVEPNELVDPWVGVGAGFESVSVKLDERNSTLGFSGFEFFNLALGLDVRLLDALRLGPYLQVALGGYSSISDAKDIYDFDQGCPGDACALTDDSVEMDELHTWVTGGLRVSHVF